MKFEIQQLVQEEMHNMHKKVQARDVLMETRFNDLKEVVGDKAVWSEEALTKRFEIFVAKGAHRKSGLIDKEFLEMKMQDVITQMETDVLNAWDQAEKRLMGYVEQRTDAAVSDVQHDVQIKMEERELVHKHERSQDTLLYQRKAEDAIHE